MGTETRRVRTVTWDDPFVVMQNAPGKTGLEILREMFEGRLPPPPIANLMGFTGVSADEGRVVFEGEPGEYLYNPIGVVHGGFAMTLLDSAMGCAVHSTLDVGERYTTLEVKTNFVRPITVNTFPSASAARARCCIAAAASRPRRERCSRSAAGSCWRMERPHA